MEAPQGLLKRGQRKRKRLWAIGAAVVVVILIVIIVPCAILLPDNSHGGKASTALIPLYIYPVDDAWAPLFRSITDNPSVPFAVVINPQSGPGDSDSPGDEYVSAIERLNSYPNVQTFGYVRTEWAGRDLDTVLNEIERYAGWAEINQTLALNGIFFDEAPHDYSDDKLDFLENVNEAVKNSDGLAEPRAIIHNPGVIPDERLMSGDARADITVVFEQSFQELQVQEDSLDDDLDEDDRSDYAYVVHSVPSGKDLGKLLANWSHQAEYLFVTTLDEDYYNSFGSSWRRFIEGIPT
ncbi:hypothetical protein MBLNU230_g6401t1 [Neophaeotheca triangularis]